MRSASSRREANSTPESPVSRMSSIRYMPPWGSSARTPGALPMASSAALARPR